MCKKLFRSVMAAAAVWLSADMGQAQIAEAPASGLTGRTIQAIGYRVGGGSTRVDFKNTRLIAQAGGEAEVEASEMLILENAVRKGTRGKRFVVNDYRLMKRNQYERLGNPLVLIPDLKNVPLEMYEARNAMDIAKVRQAEKYAPDIFMKAEGALRIAENALARKDVVSSARQATQFAEDARALSVDLQEQERIAAERAAVDAEAKAAEAAEARRRTVDEARRQAELTAARQARIEAEAPAREAIAATRARAEADALRPRKEAARTEAEHAHQAATDLRARLLEQFNRILETLDSPRGLVVTMADVLFDTGKFDLRLDAREKLARLSGIVMAHPGLNLAVEGHTDNTGSDESNRKLSEQRAQTVRAFLIKQGLAGDSITAVGLGKELPVADNSTAAGRQRNRRVELIVSGEVIGVKIRK